jgi:hypothetical protein
MPPGGGRRHPKSRAERLKSGGFTHGGDPGTDGPHLLREHVTTTASHEAIDHKPSRMRLYDLKG